MRSNYALLCPAGRRLFYRIYNGIESSAKGIADNQLIVALGIKRISSLKIQFKRVVQLLNVLILDWYQMKFSNYIYIVRKGQGLVKYSYSKKINLTFQKSNAVIHTVLKPSMLYVSETLDLNLKSDMENL